MSEGRVVGGLNLGSTAGRQFLPVPREILSLGGCFLGGLLGLAFVKQYVRSYVSARREFRRGRTAREAKYSGVM
jgi:hypothetical protein